LQFIARVEFTFQDKRFSQNVVKGPHLPLKGLQIMREDIFRKVLMEMPSHTSSVIHQREAPIIKSEPFSGNRSNVGNVHRLQILAEATAILLRGRDVASPTSDTKSSILSESLSILPADDMTVQHYRRCLAWYEET